MPKHGITQLNAASKLSAAIEPLRLLPACLTFSEVVTTSHAEDADWAGADFWLFDDETVALMHYDKVGRFVGVAEAADIDRYRAARATGGVRWRQPRRLHTLMTQTEQPATEHVAASVSRASGWLRLPRRTTAVGNAAGFRRSPC